jgi:hypothetical protein
MVRGQMRAQDGAVPRLLVLWSRPHHLTCEEAERWARAEIRTLLGADGIGHAELTRLRSPSVRHACDWRWLLELEVSGPVSDCVERGPCAEWLGDLRLLGMRPAVIMAIDSVGLDEEHC